MAGRQPTAKVAGYNVDSETAVEKNSETIHKVGTLKITQNPEKHVLKNCIDENRTRHNIAVYEHAPQSYVPEKTGFKESDSSEISKVDEFLRILASDSESPMLFGPAGTGKNTLIQHVCAKLNRPMYRKQSAEGATVQDLIGQESLQDDTTATSLNPLGMAAVFGGVAVVDEINLASARVNSTIMSIAEEIGKRQIEIPGSGGAVLSDLPESENWDADKHLGKYIHPECVIVATRNPPSYSGARKLNDALNDRFSPIKVSYLKPEKEAELLSNELDVSQSDTLPLAELAYEVREAREQGEGSTCPISYRRLRDTVKCAKAHDVTLYKASMNKIVMYAQLEQDRNILEQTISDHKRQLNTLIGEDNTYECKSCSYATNYEDEKDRSEERRKLCKLCICPDCHSAMEYHGDNPYKVNGEDFHETSRIEGYAWSEHFNSLILIFKNTNDGDAHAYLYDNNIFNKDYYEQLDKEESKGRYINNSVKSRSGKNTNFEYWSEKMRIPDLKLT